MPESISKWNDVKEKERGGERQRKGGGKKTWYYTFWKCTGKLGEWQPYLLPVLSEKGEAVEFLVNTLREGRSTRPGGTGRLGVSNHSRGLSHERFRSESMRDNKCPRGLLSLTITKNENEVN